MSPLINLLIKLYPRSWRERYEDEFRAMLEQYQPTLWEGLDILKDAFDAQRRNPMQISQSNGRSWRSLAFAGALIMPVMVILIIFVAPLLSVEESATEFLVLLAPTALLPLVVGLHRRLNTAHPTISRWALAAGLIGTLAIPAAFPLQLVINQIAPVEWTGFVYLSLLAALGVWMLLVCVSGLLPKALSVVGMFGGVGWIVWMAIISLNMLGINATFVSMLGLFFGLIVVPGWAVWAAVWLFQQRPVESVDAPVAVGN